MGNHQRNSSWSSPLMLRLSAVLLMGSALAQTIYPEKLIRCILPLAPGGGASNCRHTPAKKLTARQLESQGLEASPTTSEAFAKYLSEDQGRWKNVARALRRNRNECPGFVVLSMDSRANPSRASHSPVSRSRCHRRNARAVG